MRRIGDPSPRADNGRQSPDDRPSVDGTSGDVQQNDVGSTNVVVPDYVIVGHFSRDVVPDGFRLGGTAAYSGLAAARLGCRVGVLTSAGPDLDVVAELRGAATRALGVNDAVGPLGSGARIEVAVVAAPISTSFENVYVDGHRRQTLRSRAATIAPPSVPSAWRGAAVVHLGPIAQEVTADLFAAFPGARVRGVTPQGWLRRWDAAGRVESADLADPRAALGTADAVVLSEEDVAGDASVLERYAAATRRLVVTQGAAGATLNDAGQRTTFPACSVREVDPTGAGDVFATAFLIWLAETGDAEAAVRFANAAASFAVEGLGTSTLPTRAEVEARARTALAARPRGGGATT